MASASLSHCTTVVWASSWPKRSSVVSPLIACGTSPTKSTRPPLSAKLSSRLTVSSAQVNDGGTITVDDLEPDELTDLAGEIRSFLVRALAEAKAAGAGAGGDREGDELVERPGESLLEQQPV